MKTGCNCTIYLLTNKVNNKIYVGQTWLPLHKRMGRDGSNYKNSIYLYAAIQKHGAAFFEYTVLDICVNQATADTLESKFINQYDSRNPEIGYNLKEGGSAGKHSEETKLKQSLNSSKYWLGKLLPDETKKKIGEANTGHIHTEEWKENNSVFMKDRHRNNGHPMLGKHHTEESIAKISASSKGRKRSPGSVAQGAAAKRMSAKREQTIIRAYQENMTFDEMVKKFAVGRGGIYRILNRNNIPKR